MPQVLIDIPKLKSFAEDRGFTLAALERLCGFRISPKMEKANKVRIHEVLKNKAMADKLAEVQRHFPEAVITEITTMKPGHGGGPGG